MDKGKLKTGLNADKNEEVGQWRKQKPTKAG